MHARRCKKGISFDMKEKRKRQRTGRREKKGLQADLKGFKENGDVTVRADAAECAWKSQARPLTNKH